VALPSFLNDANLRLLFFGGKGGVGKTTCATATAFRLAAESPRRRFLLVSSDPAHSVYDSIVETPIPLNLDVLELNARECLGVFKEKHSRLLHEIARRGTFLDDRDITGVLDLSLPGLDEIMALLEIARFVNEASYDCIVVDTAPTGHTLRLLSMPQLIRDWLGALDALLAKSRYMRMLLRGSFQADGLDDFLLGLSDSVNQMQQLFRDPRQCRFVPVMLAEAMSVHETCLLLDHLEEMKVSVVDILVNRIHPAGTCTFCAGRRDSEMHELRNLLRRKRSKHHLFWAVPLFPAEVRGPDALHGFWEPVTTISQSDRRIVHLPIMPPVSEGTTSRHPLPLTRLSFFIGKGGVGKTTLACATALQLASTHQGFEPKEVLLFSLDPAHSLSACLQLKVGPKPKRVAPRLTAVEIDTQAEFQAFKLQARTDVERFLQSAFSNIDLVFDREVLEKIIDLSPPGLDEIVALTYAMDLAAQDRYDYLVVDAAPTGHFIRFMELPDLITQWLKVIFGILLKYRNIFGLPALSRRLVKISKHIKILKDELQDPVRSALHVVAIPTEMAFQETRDLVATCQNMGFNVPSVFLNLVTPPGDCSLCSARHEAESQMIRKYAQAFFEKQRTIVYTGQTPSGLSALEDLGNALYGVPRVELMPQAR